MVKIISNTCYPIDFVSVSNTRRPGQISGEKRADQIEPASQESAGEAGVEQEPVFTPKNNIDKAK